MDVVQSVSLESHQREPQNQPTDVNKHLSFPLRPPASLTTANYGVDSDSIPRVHIVSPSIRKEITSDGQLPPVGYRSSPTPLPASLRSDVQFNAAVHHYQFQGIGPSTRLSYNSGIKCYLTFVQMHSSSAMPMPWMFPSESLFTYFVSH